MHISAIQCCHQISDCQVTSQYYLHFGLIQVRRQIKDACRFHGVNWPLTWWRDPASLLPSAKRGTESVRGFSPEQQLCRTQCNGLQWRSVDIGKIMWCNMVVEHWGEWCFVIQWTLNDLGLVEAAPAASWCCMLLLLFYQRGRMGQSGNWCVVCCSIHVAS